MSSSPYWRFSSDGSEL